MDSGSCSDSIFEYLLIRIPLYVASWPVRKKLQITSHEHGRDAAQSGLVKEGAIGKGDQRQPYFVDRGVLELNLV